jgi:HAD superfamily hydrolase (TIGR01509 family)
MIRGVIFDCFGVLYEGSLEYLASLAPPERREAVYEVNRAADYGYISHDEYLSSMAELIDTQPEEVEKISRERFIRNDPLVDYVRSLRPQYKTALLSNVGYSVMGTLFTEKELTGLFDAVVLSGEVGMVKPYPEIFELTASRLGLRPEECVMIDDLPKNTEGAERVGMKGLVYGSVRQIKTDLNDLAEIEESRHA